LELLPLVPYVGTLLTAENTEVSLNRPSLEHLRARVPDAATERMKASHLIASLARLAENFA